MKAIEINTKTDSSGHLKVDIPLKEANQKVRLLVLFDEQNTKEDDVEWLYSTAKNPSFDFLCEPEEDIYSLNDGTPVKDEK